MRLHIIRHADPDYERNTITELGHREAAALAERMATAGLTRIYASPLGRARDTARYTEEATGLRAQVLDWTAELSAPHIVTVDGSSQPIWNIDGEVVRAGSLESVVELHDPAYGRIMSDLERESDALLAGFGYRRDAGVYAIEERSDENVAVFCHAGFGMTWLAQLLALPAPLLWTGLFLAPTSVTTVLMEERSATTAVPRALAVGDTSHLYVAGLHGSTRGLLGI
jgi:probable phosphoglycerate mutase